MRTFIHKKSCQAYLGFQVQGRISSKAHIMQIIQTQWIKIVVDSYVSSVLGPSIYWASKGIGTSSGAEGFFLGVTG